MRFLVCGDRNFIDAVRLDEVLSQYDITEVVEGEARGADTMARLWAESRGIPVLKFPAKWSEYGRAAGPIRNKQMLDEGKPDEVIAFVAASSSGTRNMIDQSRRAGLKVHVIEV